MRRQGFKEPVSSFKFPVSDIQCPVLLKSGYPAFSPFSGIYASLRRATSVQYQICRNEGPE
jgi:hypothetical protein